MPPFTTPLWDIKDGLGFYIGTNIQTRLHVHHALEVVVALRNPFKIHTGTGHAIESNFSIIAPDYSHGFSGADDVYLFVYLDSAHLLATQIESHLRVSQFGVLSETELHSWEAVGKLRNEMHAGFASGRITIAMLQSQLSGLLPLSLQKAKSDVRITKAANFVKASLQQRISLAGTAAQVFLSPSRFAHLFRSQTGIPFRRYVLWCRMQASLEAVMNGQSITTAAYEGGFADAAHLSRTFMEMFGVTPSSVLKK